jgi:hypothetical protein
MLPAKNVPSNDAGQLPTTKIAATMTSQPSTAVLRCRALHPAIRSTSGTAGRPDGTVRDRPVRNRRVLKRCSFGRRPAAR